MKARTVLIIVGVLVVGLVVGLAASTIIRGSSDSDEATDRRTITVAGQATVEQSPDQAVLNLSVQSEDEESATALSDNAEKMDAILEAVKGAGVDEQDIRTTNGGLSRQVVGRNTSQERTVFVARSGIEVTVKDLDAIGDVIDAAVGAGATSVRGVQFGVSDPDKVQADALKQAVENSRGQADALASASGAEVVDVVSIDRSGGGGGYRGYATADAISLNSAPPAAYKTQIVAPDTLKVEVRINVVWEID